MKIPSAATLCLQLTAIHHTCQAAPEQLTGAKASLGARRAAKEGLDGTFGIIDAGEQGTWAPAIMEKDTLLTRLQAKLKAGRENSPRERQAEKLAAKAHKEVPVSLPVQEAPSSTVEDVVTSGDELWTTSPLRAAEGESEPFVIESEFDRRSRRATRLPPLSVAVGRPRPARGDMEEESEHTLVMEKPVISTSHAEINYEDLIMLLATLLKHAKSDGVASEEDVKRLATSLYEQATRLAVESVGEEALEELTKGWERQERQVEDFDSDGEKEAEAEKEVETIDASDLIYKTWSGSQRPTQRMALRKSAE